MFASLFSFCRFVVCFTFVFALWGMGMWASQLAMHPDATITEFIMFEFLAIVPILCLLLLGFMAGSKKDKQPIQEIRDMHSQIKEDKQEMIDFIHRVDRIQYFCHILSWIYYHDKEMYQFIVKNPNYIRDYWLVCPSDLCVYEDGDGTSYNRFGRNPDAERMQRQFRDNYRTYEHVETMPWNKKKYTKRFYVQRPNGSYYKYGWDEDTTFEHSCFRNWFTHV